MTSNESMFDGLVCKECGCLVENLRNYREVHIAWHQRIEDIRNHKGINDA